MNATYFPGANTGLGFVNRFDGIVPPWAKPHYTYVLKGGPGVGKSTLMRKVAARAAAKGYTVEEFRCASDPDSFDAVRVAELRVVLLDGTAPHSIDPVIPGACDEVIDLGHFLRHEEFMREAATLRARFAANKAHYARAYACLAAARALTVQATDAAAEALDMPAVRKALAPLFAGEGVGESRRLFAASATPRGVVDYTDTLNFTGVRRYGGAAGAAIRAASRRMAAPAAAVTLCGGDKPTEAATAFLKAPLPDFVAYAKAESDNLVARAVGELSACLAVHDEIEAIYRPFVNYDRVNTESDALLARLGL